VTRWRLSSWRRLAASYLLFRVRLFFPAGRRFIFSFGRFYGPARNFPGRNYRHDFSDPARRITSRRRRLPADDARFVFGNLHNLHVFRENASLLVIRRLDWKAGLLGLDDSLDLDDFPARGIRTTNVFAFKLRIQLVTLLASRANDGDVHAIGSNQRKDSFTSFLF
jgi:hypothetical protein